MPYINGEDRPALEYGEIVPITSGELNFLITVTVDNFLSYRGRNYDTINEVIGVLECAKLELYRRIAAPYEDIKMEQNGDVYSDINRS